ncbi:MAG: GAF domain-containing protein [Chloroflexota bacterium]
MKTKHTQELVLDARNRSVSWNKRAEQLIEMGLEKLDLELGIISRINQDKYTVLYSNNQELIGKEFQLGVTYCQITMSLRHSRVLAVENFAVSDYFRHPAYKEFNLEAYIGGPIVYNERPLGTINFTKSEKRTSSFTSEEKEFTKKLAKAAAFLVMESNMK